MPAAVEVAAYRIVQEGLMNVVKGSRAEACRVGITLGDALAIEIADDGIGLPARPNSGVGLRSIRERADELGGTCKLSDGAWQGTQIVVRLPLVRGGKA